MLGGVQRWEGSIRVGGGARARGDAGACASWEGQRKRERSERDLHGVSSEIAAEWRTSLHARADRDDAYQRAFALEPLPFCQGCHAPETDAFKPVPALAADLGVGCVTCHVVNERVLATPNAPNAPRSQNHAEKRTKKRTKREQEAQSRAARPTRARFLNSTLSPAEAVVSAVGPLAS